MAKPDGIVGSIIIDTWVVVLAHVIISVIRHW